VEFSLFDEVGNVLIGMVPSDLGDLRRRSGKYGIKVWFGGSTDKATPEHYEAQVIHKKHVPDAAVLGIEVGFHAEHSQLADNNAVLERLAADAKRWRKALGNEAVAGPFLGRAERWRRISETWPDPDLGDTDLAVELAARLADYITTLEPLRRVATGPR
jgi:hypothetical protein